MLENNFDNLFPVFDETEELETNLPIIEEEEQEIEKNTPPNSSQDTPDSIVEPQDDEIATLFYKELVERNIALPQEGKENYSWEDINTVLTHYQENLPQAVANAIISSVSPVGQKFIDYVLTKGNDLTEDALTDFFSKYKTSTSITDFSDLTSARDYLSSKYKDQGFRQSQIDAMLDALEDEEVDGKALLTEANKFAQKDKSLIDQTLEQEKQAKAQKQEQIRQENEILYSKTLEAIEATDWKKERKEKIKQHLSSSVFNETLSKAFKSPKALMQIVNLSTYFDEKSGEFKFDDFVRQVTSKSASSLKDAINKDMFSSASRTSKGGASNPNRTSLLDSLVPISPLSED